MTAPASQEARLGSPRGLSTEAPQVYMCLQGKTPGSTASPQSVFQVTGSPTPLALLALSLTDPTLLSSCSSALLNSALLWMAAMASGCSCLMAWQASLGRRETEG